MVPNHILSVSFAFVLIAVLSACQPSGLSQSFRASLPIEGEIIFGD